MRSRRGSLAASLLAVAAALALVLVGQGAVAQQRSLAVVPTPALLPTSAPMSDAEAAAARAAAAPNRVWVSGPNTAGTTISIAGTEVQLPPDAYVESFIVNVSCYPGQTCPEVPYYILRRGSSTIAIVRRSGIVIQESLAAGEADAFRFLDGVRQ